MTAYNLDTTLPPVLAPLAWLAGRWEGAGVVGYPTMEQSFNFGQEIRCWHDGRPFLHWQSQSWILDAEGNKERVAATEYGFWRVIEETGETELLLTHPTGILELYVGRAEPAKVELRTDGVLRSPAAKEYNAASRLYGLVSSNLMWVMDMAAVGEPLTSHVSAELKRVG